MKLTLRTDIAMSLISDMFWNEMWMNCLVENFNVSPVLLSVYRMLMCK